MAAAPKQKTLLIVDDDEGMRDTLTAILRREYHLVTAPSGEAGLEALAKSHVDLMLLDVRLPGINGLDVLKLVKEQYPVVEVVVISAVSEVEIAVQAIKQGAYHFITKDFEYDALRSLVRKVAKLSATVLVHGESGTGKEMLARLLHRESTRSQGPFIAVNLAALPSELVESTLFGHEKGAFTGATKQQLGKFEMAAGGTLFLDEIGDLKLELQAKLLRAIQEGEIERVGGSKPLKADFRLIVATNVDLERAVRDGRFREDLYYRINVIPIRMPPLRERIEDLPMLVDTFFKRYNARFHKNVTGAMDGAMNVFRSYWWPGNIRELQNLIERLVAVDERGWVQEEDLPFEYQIAHITTSQPSSEGRFVDAVNAFERTLILRALSDCEWNVTAASRHLGMPLSTLKHKIQRFEIRDAVKRLREA